MKIFISHSSKDKWAARRISEDILNLGAETFLDEKDIQTGYSIDESIKKNLKECDDFLILLSPASINSQWVLIELGAAIVLEKKITPILLYVGVNEVPQIINLKLARDINSVDIYYEEIKNSLSVKKVTKPRIPRPKYTYKPNDKLKVVTQRPKDIMRGDFLIDWEPEMDAFLGQIVTIKKYNSRGVSEAYVLNGDNDEYLFAKEWLRIVK